MWGRRTDRSRRKRLEFQSTLDGSVRLEPKVVLSHFHQPLGIPGQVRTAAGGAAVEVTTPQGQTFYVHVTTGRIRAKFNRAQGGFDITVVNSAIDSEVTINPIVDFSNKGTAHTYNPRPDDYTNMLKITSLNVKSGTIGAILGYRDAVLAGPLTSLGTSRIDRIAFDAILPGAAIRTGGDVNILNVLNDLTLTGENNVVAIGRDLNSFTVGGNITLSNGADFVVGRDVGLNPQFHQGTAPDTTGLSAIITGNITINPGSKFVITRNVDLPFEVQGSIFGASNFSINAVPLPLPRQPLLYVGGTINA